MLWRFENQITGLGIKIPLDLGEAGTYSIIILIHRFFLRPAWFQRFRLGNVHLN